MCATRLWRCLILGLMLAALGLVACSRSSRPALTKVEPMLLAGLALAPADLDDLYLIDSDSYLDQDGNPVSTASRDYERQLRAKDQTPGANPEAVAATILITLADQGPDAAAEFVDVADDENVGPPNLADYIQQRIHGSHDIHAELVDEFPSYDDATVANRLSWQQSVNGTDETEDAYGVYIRSGGVLTLVALRAPADANGNEPEGLRRQAESVVHKQADKLKNGPPPVIGPRTRAAASAGAETKE